MSKPSALRETSLLNSDGFECDICRQIKDDLYILPDGSVLCTDCFSGWEHDRTKQN